MQFHDVRFPADLSFGSAGGPERRTEVVTLANGFEERNSPWADSRRRYDAGLGLRTLGDVETVIAFFEARRGRLHAFRWKDWSDFRSGGPVVSATDQEIGTGDGAATEFQLRKTYRSGSYEYVREIRKPVEGSVRVVVDGSELSEGFGFSVDAATGAVSLIAAPDARAVVSAGFAFDVPVRFDTDSLRISAAGFEAGEVPDIPIVEVRL